MQKIFKKPLFSWGSKNISKAGENRTNFINAVKQADQGNITPLINFALS